LDRMLEASDLLKGEHDFRNFSSCKNYAIRTILELKLSENNGLMTFDIRADGFLWNMVRRIVSALELIGAGSKDIDWIHDLLNPKLNEGAPTAPAEGLIFMDVGYKDIKWEKDNYSQKRASRTLESIAKRRISSACVAKSLHLGMKF
jgi:tRNA pseudouridine38-40 synthase